MPAFGVRVGSRTKTFVVKTSNRRITLGRYPELSLKTARRKAHRILGSYTASESITFAEAVDDFLETRRTSNKSSTAAETHRLLKRFAFAKPLDQITRRDIFNTLAAFSPGEANHAFTAVRTLFNWCVASELLSITPLQNARPPHKTAPRDRLLTDQEIERIWANTFAHEQYGNIIRCLILTGQRLNQWSSFEEAWLNGDSILFPARIMKGNRDHAIPAPPLLIPHLPKLATPVTSHSKPMARFRNTLDPMPHWTLHDLRRYFSSTMAKLKVPIDVTEAILDHRSGSRSHIQRIYDRHDRLPQMREALALYHQHLSRFCEGLNLREPR